MAVAVFSRSDGQDLGGFFPPSSTADLQFPSYALLSVSCLLISLLAEVPWAVAAQDHCGTGRCPLGCAF